MGVRVLVIEDNGANRELMTYLLHAFGHTVIEASNGEDGLNLIRSECPDLVVCDIHLPRRDGYSIIESIRSDPVLRQIPIVAVTALSMVGDRSHIVSAGFSGYIPKPIQPETFVQQLEEFLRARRD
jgi:two-component system, cell cycle response regulator DivK